MDALVGGMLIGVFGGVAGGLVVLVLALVLRRKKCPGCGAALPRFRTPANRRQALWGGATCPECGCEVDARGRKVPPGE